MAASMALVERVESTELKDIPRRKYVVQPTSAATIKHYKADDSTFIVDAYAAFLATGAGAIPFGEHPGIFWPRVLAAALSLSATGAFCSG